MAEDMGRCFVLLPTSSAAAVVVAPAPATVQGEDIESGLVDEAPVCKPGVTFLLHVVGGQIGGSNPHHPALVQLRGKDISVIMLQVHRHSESA